MIRRFVTIAVISAFLAAPAIAQQPKTARKAQRQQQQLRESVKQGNKKTAKQRRRNAKQAEGQRAQKLQRALKLSDAQTAQVRTLMSTRDQQLAQLKGSAKAQRKQDAQAIRNQFQTGLRGVLSPDQAQQIESKRNGRKGPGR